MTELTTWPADKVERRPVATLIPYAKNARTHSDAQVAQIAESIRKWGWTMPVLVDEGGGLIAGHGRIMAAGLLGIKDVPVMVAAGWSEADKRAYVIADNKLALNSDWNYETLMGELADLQSQLGDLSPLGFSEIELGSLLHADGYEIERMAEWAGMPEFVSDDQESFRQIIIHFRNAEDVQEFAKLIGQEFTDKTRFLWFPENEIERWIGKKYVEDTPQESVPDLHSIEEPGGDNEDAPRARPARRTVPRGRRGKSVH